MLLKVQQKLALKKLPGEFPFSLSPAEIKWAHRGGGIKNDGLPERGQTCGITARVRHESAPGHLWWLHAQSGFQRRGGRAAATGSSALQPAAGPVGQTHFRLCVEVWEVNANPKKSLYLSWCLSEMITRCMNLNAHELVPIILTNYRNVVFKCFQMLFVSEISIIFFFLK